MPKPPRAPSVQGDIERLAARHKTNTPTGGVPLIPIETDEELTPPPQAIPIEQLAALDADEQLAVLRQSAQEHAEALARVWESRNLHENVVTLGKDVAELTTLMRDFMMPAVKGMQGRLDALEQGRHAESGRQARFWEHEWPSALEQLKQISSHMSRIEKDVDRVERNLDGYMKRDDAEKAQLRAEIAELKTKDAEKTQRIRTLEDFMLSVKSKVALVSAGMGSGGAGLMWLIQHFMG